MLKEPFTAAQRALAPMLDALTCGAALIDRVGTIVYANPRLCQMMKRSAVELRGANLIRLCQSDDARAAVEESLAHFDEMHEGETLLPLPDGSRLTVIASSRPLAGANGSADVELVTMIDISAQKAAEQRLRDHYEILVNMSNTVLEQAVELKRYSALLEQRVRERTRDLHDANVDAIYMLAVASEAKDADTGEHVRRIQKLTELLASRLGFTEAESLAIGQFSILHDVGKIHVPDAILEKPGPLSEEQRTRMQEHTIAGEHILSDRAFFDVARRVARSHHENWDGSGYPDGLIGEAIPVEARITRVADVWDALTHARVYKEAWPPERAVEVIRLGRGTLFEPRVVDALTDLYEQGQLPPR